MTKKEFRKKAKRLGLADKEIKEAEELGFDGMIAEIIYYGFSNLYHWIKSKFQNKGEQCKPL